MSIACLKLFHVLEIISNTSYLQVAVTWEQFPARYIISLFTVQFNLYFYLGSIDRINRSYLEILQALGSFFFTVTGISILLSLGIPTLGLQCTLDRKSPTDFCLLPSELTVCPNQLWGQFEIGNVSCPLK